MENTMKFQLQFSQISTAASFIGEYPMVLVLENIEKLIKDFDPDYHYEHFEKELPGSYKSAGFRVYSTSLHALSSAMTYAINDLYLKYNWSPHYTLPFRLTSEGADGWKEPKTERIISQSPTQP